MKYLLMATLICILLAFLTYRWADRPGDDFGAAFPAVVMIIVSVVMVVWYVWAVIVQHRFW